MKEATSFIP